MARRGPAGTALLALRRLPLLPLLLVAMAPSTLHLAARAQQLSTFNSTDPSSRLPSFNNTDSSQTVNNTDLPQTAVNLTDTISPKVVGGKTAPEGRCAGRSWVQHSMPRQNKTCTKECPACRRCCCICARQSCPRVGLVCIADTPAFGHVASSLLVAARYA